MKTMKLRMIFLSKLLLLLVLGNFALMQFASAKPLKINDARWKGNYSHPAGGSSSLSSDGKTLTTTLPAANNISSDYTVHYRLFTNMGDPLPVTVRPLSHTQMISCNNSTPQSNQPIFQNSCTAKRYTPNEGMRRLTQPTRVKIEVRASGSPTKYLWWKFEPKPIPLPVSCNYKIGFWHPANNQHFAKGTKVSVRAQLKQGSSVLYMDLYLNNQLIRRDYKHPYEWGHAVNDFRLRSLQPGTHTLKIKTKDNCGDSKEKTRIFYIDAQ